MAFVGLTDTVRAYTYVSMFIYTCLHSIVLRVHCRGIYDDSEVDGRGLWRDARGCRAGCLHSTCRAKSIPRVVLKQSNTRGIDFVSKVAQHRGLQSLTVSLHFDQSMEKVALPSGLQSLTFGSEFNQSTEKVVLPSRLQSLTFGFHWSQSMKRVLCPAACRV